jgi:uncharacterized damage-inducible protein DinB
MTVETEFLTFSADKLAQLMEHIETCVEKLTPEQVWARGSDTQNAVGNLLLHLNGNLRQWILHGIAGQPDTRDRDSEFAARDAEGTRELLSTLKTTVAEVNAVIRALPPARLTDPFSNQGYEVTVLSAIYHVVEHFAGHAFQIIFMTKQFTGGDLGFYAHLSGAKTRTSSLP